MGFLPPLPRPPELVLDLGPSIVGGLTLPVDAFRLNHFPGFEKNWDKPPEGEVDRGKDGEGGPDGDDGNAKS